MTATAPGWYDAARWRELMAIVGLISSPHAYKSSPTVVDWTPRPGSEEKIGTLIDAKAILHDLRTTPGLEPALGLPPGPNSGLSAKLP